MQIRFRELTGKEVIGSDGQRIGRVSEVVVQRRGQGDQLEVCALRVGLSGWWQRIAFRRLGASLDEIPWQLIERIDRKIYLKVTAQDAKDATDEQAKVLQSKENEIPT